MVHTKVSGGSQDRVIGRPFQKGNYKGKPRNEILDSKRPAIGNKQADIAPDEKQASKTPLKEEKMEPQNLPVVKKEVEAEENILVEAIEFKNGDNALRITLMRKTNRVYRIQVFLNDGLEIRPSTYTGSSGAMNVWKLLKSYLKKD